MSKEIKTPKEQINVKEGKVRPESEELANAIQNQELNLLGEEEAGLYLPVCMIMEG